MDNERNTILPIQKLIISHWQLAELSTGESLSDGASEESLREEILYYYNGSSSLNQWTASSPIEKTREAITFNGMCKALYRLPYSFVSSSMTAFSHDSDDATQEVYLGDSVLIFVRIEPQSIVAIIQASQSVKPSAIRASLTRSHGLFYLLRGGGIHRRLCSSHEPIEKEMIYAPMEPIYRLWKEVSHEESRQRRSSLHNDGHQLLELIDRIDNLYKKLPIIPLRQDLRIHYDAYVGQLNQQASTPNMFCSFTEETPVPAYRMNGAHIRFSLPSRQPLEHTSQMQDAIATFLKSQNKDSAYILHVACFFDGKIMFQNDMMNSEISQDTLSWTWSYMQHIRFQMLSLQRVSHPNSRSSTPIRKTGALTQLMLSLGKSLEDSVQLAPATASPDDRCYLPPPPLALLSTLDKANGFKGPSEDSVVWGLPVSFDCRYGDKSFEAVDAYASMYCCGDFSFLIFWRQGIKPRTDHSVHLFRGFESILSDALHRYPSGDLATNVISGRREKLRWEGADIVFIDRARDNLILLSDPSRQLLAKSERSSRSPRTATPPKPQSEHNDLSRRDFDNLDCRHLLASTLPTDIILCLEDALAKVNKTAVESLPFEMCAFTPQGWVYAQKDKTRNGQHEIYMVFDVSKFVTLTDVEITARETCRRIISLDEKIGKL
jgi:hypothetical protein